MHACVCECVCVCARVFVCVWTQRGIERKRKREIVRGTEDGEGLELFIRRESQKRRREIGKVQKAMTTEGVEIQREEHAPQQDDKEL